MIGEIALDRLTRQSGQLAQVGKIVRLDLPDALANRLKAMGLFEGQDVAVSRGGNPMIVKAAGGKIAVAAELARQIMVQTEMSVTPFDRIGDVAGVAKMAGVAKVG